MQINATDKYDRNRTGNWSRCYHPNIEIEMKAMPKSHEDEKKVNSSSLWCEVALVWRCLISELRRVDGRMTENSRSWNTVQTPGEFIVNLANGSEKWRGTLKGWGGRELEAVDASYEVPWNIASGFCIYHPTPDLSLFAPTASLSAVVPFPGEPKDQKLSAVAFISRWRAVMR